MYQKGQKPSDAKVQKTSHSEIKDPAPESPTATAFESAAASEKLAGKRAPKGVQGEGGRLLNDPTSKEEQMDSIDEVVDVDDDKPKLT